MSVGPIRRLRRTAIDRALAAGASASGRLSDGLLAVVARDAVRISGVVLRPLLRSNLRQVLGPDRPLRQIEHAYFDRAADWARYTALTFHRGFDRSGFTECSDSDDTRAHLEDASAAGRGVVLVGAHQFCHELFAAFLRTRLHIPLVGVIRQEDRNAALFERWYRQLGLPTIQRPRSASAISDFRALLRVLRDGATLGITPDLPGGPAEAEEVTFFGRPVRLRAGAFWLALHSGAPVVEYWIDRVGSRWIVRFSSAVRIEREPGLPPTHTIRRHLQAWSTDFERELRAQPDSWAFWLDRRWTRVLCQPRTAGR